jgi:HAD superfamily hydrolase (TIGR01509 family)
MKAIIFDLDGVLIDSEPLHWMADNKLLMDLGIYPPENYFDRFVGWTSEAMWEEIRNDYHLNINYEELMELHMTIKLKLLQESEYKPIPGIIGLLEGIKMMQIPMAIASSSPKLFIEAVIEKISIRKYFTKYLSGEEVQRSKPEPDIFLKIAELLEVNPAECIVIEDSTSGTIAAKKAGMKCIGYRNVNSGNQDLSNADFIVNNIEEIDFAKMMLTDLHDVLI